MLCWEIDSNGNIIEHYDFTQQQVDDAVKNGQKIITTPWGPGFYSPKYDLVNNKWVEGLTQAQLLSNAQQAKLSQLRGMYQQTLNAGFKATIGTKFYSFGWSTQDQVNLNSTQTAVEKGFATFPITYADVNGSPVTLSAQADLDAIEQEATKFAFAQHQQILNLVGQVQTATTPDAVNAVQWQSASY